MRKEYRFLSKAQIYIATDNSEIKAELRDISIHGLSIKSVDFLNIVPNTVYKIAIIPENEAAVGKFHLEIQSRWIKMKNLTVESGFSLMTPLDEAEFEQYLQYLNSLVQAEGKEVNPEPVKEFSPEEIVVYTPPKQIPKIPKD
jgi:hypothetical protein